MLKNLWKWLTKPNPMQGFLDREHAIKDYQAKRLYKDFDL